MLNKETITPILAIGLVVVAVLLAFGDGAPVQGVQEEILSVSGNAEVTVSPDKAEIQLGVTTLETTAERSRSRNAEISDAVLAALREAGVAEEDIETSQFSIYPEYEYRERPVEPGYPYPDSERVLVGYRTTHTVTVTTEAIEEVGKITDAGVKAGATNVNSISFGLTKEKEKEVKQEAMLQASEDAKSKASALADALGVRLGSISRATESEFNYIPYYAARDGFDMAVAESAAGAGTKISPQDLDVYASVNVDYKIR